MRFKPAAAAKIINDPVYGFITIDHPMVLAVMLHPCYQRLRRISQMGFANLVYPGAVHTRLHHSLGAFHLMGNALNVLQTKGIELSTEECLGAKLAILLHDIGHGPFSHALENRLIKDVHHETVSLEIMQLLNREFSGALDTAIAIFKDTHPKKFLHQLVSGQLDTDRMDYLIRDSFYTGVSEGVIGYDRIIHMLTVSNGDLMVEEKGIYSIEKFLVARRLMYWQVYLHKTVVCAEAMLINSIERAKFLIRQGAAVPSGSADLDGFLSGKMTQADEYLDSFGRLDDIDVIGALKRWKDHPDKVLSLLSAGLLDRRLLKVKLQAEPVDDFILEEEKRKTARLLGLTSEEAGYLVFSGEHTNTTYNPGNEAISILFRDGSVRDISAVDNALIQRSLAAEVKKFYICYYKAANG